MEISVRFRLRPVAGGSTSRDGMQVFQARITMDGKEDAGFSTGIRISPLHWDQARQRVTLRNDPDRVQERLEQIRADLKRVYRLKRDMHEQGLGPVVTIALIKAAYKDWRNPDAGLLDRAPGMVPLRECLSRYVDYLRSQQGLPGGLCDKTIADRARTERYLTAYLNDKNKTEPMAATVTPAWVDGFKYYLYSRTGLTRKAKTLSAGSAWIIVNDVQQAVAHVHRQDGGFVNPLQGVRHSKGPGKAVYFLDPAQLDTLFSTEFTGLVSLESKKQVTSQIVPALWWVRLMCLVGMDYVDAVRYARDPAQFEQDGPAGRKIVIRRTKPPHNECNIPLVGQMKTRLSALMAEGVPLDPSDKTLHRSCVRIGELLGFEKRFTAKICRKSAGAAFLMARFSIEGVSNILGHSTPYTTTKHYVKVIGQIVDRDQAAVEAWLAQNGE